MYLSEEVETYYKDDDGHFVQLSIDDPYDRFRFTVGVSDRHGECDGINDLLKAMDTLEPKD